ncbi:MAG: tRNA (guanosine(46)-N7)-methyltransferase TrmB [Eubacterium sp.]|nr:tRNA (guanosine(46)-N7)-methyltransferase TrmB [Clostridia bacterium]MBO5485921.1 tRNA (guanosine(46)-N7)-methyltransferase TrmB [Eubacterium sp.]
MRLRKKKNTPQRLEFYKDFFLDFSDIKTTPEASVQDYLNCEEIFGNQNPVHIEIGAGKGDFITTLAKQNPHINYIAFEKCADVIAIAATKSEGISNLRFANLDANLLDSMFAPGSIERIYLNFSDPWPKGRHRRKRLTHKLFLQKYETVLVKGGELHFKTDNVRLFRFSLLETKEYGMQWLLLTFDLHKEYPEGNIMTEYERRFSGLGYPIQKLVAKFTD